MALDFNDADNQKSGDLIPAGTLAKVNVIIRPGKAGDDGWLTNSNSSDAQYLDCEFTILAGPHAKRKLWQNMTVAGGKQDENGQSIAANITRSTLRAMLESARGVKPSDMSPAAQAARRINSYGDLNGLEFAIKIGIEKAKVGSGYDDKNKILDVVTPDRKDYAALMAGESVAGPSPTADIGAAAAAAKPAWAQGDAPASQQASPSPNTPAWAQA